MMEVTKEICIPESITEFGIRNSDRGSDAVPPSLRRYSGPIKPSSQAGWTDEEDEQLTELVWRFNAKNWKHISASMPGRTPYQCSQRWHKVLNPDLIKGPWTKEEDNQVIELVEKHGSKKWALVAKFVRGRNGKQCRERWINHLDPAIKRDAWTEAEEATLKHHHQLLGNKWVEIAKFLPGRPENATKDHWKSMVRKRPHLNLPSISESGHVQTSLTLGSSISSGPPNKRSGSSFNGSGNEVRSWLSLSLRPCLL